MRHRCDDNKQARLVNKEHAVAGVVTRMSEVSEEGAKRRDKKATTNNRLTLGVVPPSVLLV